MYFVTWFGSADVHSITDRQNDILFEIHEVQSVIRIGIHEYVHHATRRCRETSSWAIPWRQDHPGVRPQSNASAMKEPLRRPLEKLRCSRRILQSSFLRLMEPSDIPHCADHRWQVRLTILRAGVTLLIFRTYRGRIDQYDGRSATRRATIPEKWWMYFRRKEEYKTMFYEIREPRATNQEIFFHGWSESVNTWPVSSEKISIIVIVPPHRSSEWAWSMVLD